jgi:hypothetical protein
MGVGRELLGKHVRCPRCKQVVLAPSAQGTASPKSPQAPAKPFGIHEIPTPVSPPPILHAPLAPPTPPAPRPAGSPPDSVLTFPQKETADSILSEPTESEDEVFGSHQGDKPRGPVLPDTSLDMPAKDVAAKPGEPRASAHPPELGPGPTVTLPNPFAGLEPIPAPTPAPPPPAKPPPPQPVPSAPAAPANPWAGLGEVVATPVPGGEQPVMMAPAAAPAGGEPTPTPAGEPHPRPARGARTPAAPTSGVSRVLFLAVLGYSILMTILAVYGLFLKPGDTLPPDHPLSTIPDTFGEFDPASRKKVSQFRFPVDGELPPHLRAPLGGKIELGQLTVEPLRVEARDLKVITEGKGEKKQEVKLHALVLHLRVKNTSADLAIFPMDPAFNRLANPRNDPHPATRLVVGRQAFYGGAIEWPFAPTVTRRYEEAQAGDATPLKPGEEREYVVFTDVDPELLKTVKGAKDPLLWRVQVRRGLIEFRGKEVPVTAIVGVEFTREQIEKL